MITVKEVLAIHYLLVEEFGGIHGLRDQGLLESALNRPYGEFEGKAYYKTPEEKASALIESLVTNHPFLDGNKRIGYVLMRLLLMSSNLDIGASEDEKFKFVISIAAGEKSYDQILEWIQSHLIEIQ